MAGVGHAHAVSPTVIPARTIGWFIRVGQDKGPVKPRL